MQLYRDCDPDKQIAWFTSQRRTFEAGISRMKTAPAMLALMKEGLSIVDAVVVSLLIVEHKLRLRDSRIAVGDGRVDQSFMVTAMSNGAV